MYRYQVMASSQRKTQRRKQKKQGKTRGGYVWDTKSKKKSSTIKSKYSANKKTKSAYSMLPSVIY